MENRYGDPPFDMEDDEARGLGLSIFGQPLSVTEGEVKVVEGEVVLTLVFRILLEGFVTYRALLVPFLRSAEAMRFATAVYSHVDCLFTQAKHGLPLSHFVFLSTHSRQDSVGLFRFCLGFIRGCSPLPAPVSMGEVRLEEPALFPFKLGGGGLTGDTPMPDTPAGGSDACCDTCICRDGSGNSGNDREVSSLSCRGRG